MRNVKIFPGMFIKRRAFTVIEVMVVAAIIAVLAVKVVPKIAELIVKSKAAGCLANRVILEKAEERYRVEHDGQASASLDALRQSGYLDRVPKCEAGGQYIWISTVSPVSLGCSVHNWPLVPATADLSPLGSGFPEITGNLTALIQSYFDANNRWPRTWGDYRYTDLGLDPVDWSEVPYDGLIYTPIGSSIAVKPAPGWEITVTGVDGVQKALTPALNWNIWYDMLTSKWYYKTIAPENAINISTLQVKPL